MKGNYCLVRAPEEGGNIHGAHRWVLPTSMASPCLLVKTGKVSLWNTGLSLCDIQNSGDKVGEQVWPNSTSHPLATVTG